MRLAMSRHGGGNGRLAQRVAKGVVVVTFVVFLPLMGCAEQDEKGVSTATTQTSSSIITPTTGPTATPARTEFPGIGATRADWEQSHKQAPGFAPGSSYLPFLRDGRQVTYAGVIGDDRIISYDLYMEPGTSLDQAEAMVRRELPVDARPGPRRDGGQCFLQEWRSPSLESVLKGMAVIVAYSRDDPTIPPERRYRVATFVIHTPGEEEIC